MSEGKLKHLEFIQHVIARMNTDSFLIKGWSVTLVSGLFVLAAKDANTGYIWIAYIVLPTFWVLDGFFIAVERRYRDLYNEVRRRSEAETDFDMDASRFCKGNRTWLAGIFSKTAVPFYGTAVVATLLVTRLMGG